MNKYVTTKKPITKEEYEEIITKSDAQQYSFVMDIANKSGYPACAYEFYNPRIIYRNDEYYVEWRHWSSC